MVVIVLGACGHLTMAVVMKVNLMRIVVVIVLGACVYHGVVMKVNLMRILIVVVVVMML